MKRWFCFSIIFNILILHAQTNEMQAGKSFRITSHYAMFPDSLRNHEPRIYDKKIYSAAEHYSDSSAYIFVPDYFDKNKPFHFVIWFHGWNNNIDSVLAYYHLQEQFYAAHLNAIFLFPEGPENAPDSYGGKFEKADTFNYFMNDVMNFLQKEKCINKNISFDMIYAGHSGAYRVMSYLLLYAKNNCKAVLLFDALYGEQEKFAVQLQKHPDCKMINVYTDSGGTYQNSMNLAKEMKAWQWKYVLKEEDNFIKEDLQKNQVVFLHSKKQHNDVVAYKNNFQRFLEALE